MPQPSQTNTTITGDLVAISRVCGSAGEFQVVFDSNKPPGLSSPGFYKQITLERAIMLFEHSCSLHLTAIEHLQSRNYHYCANSEASVAQRKDCQVNDDGECEKHRRTNHQQ
jgi:hypothetical protein